MAFCRQQSDNPQNFLAQPRRDTLRLTFCSSARRIHCETLRVKSTKMPKLEFSVSGVAEEELERAETNAGRSPKTNASVSAAGLSLPAIALVALAIFGISQFQQRRSYLSLDALAARSADSSANENPFGSTEWIPRALKGDVYLLAENTPRLPDFSQLTPVATVYATNLHVTTRYYASGFPGIPDRNTWFAIDYQGTVVIPEKGDYVFSLTSDDGSRLFIDGQLVIDLDGVHAEDNKSAVRHLKAGPHDIRVQYFQGPGSYLGLVLDIHKR